MRLDLATIVVREKDMISFSHDNLDT
jgi:hypothetical protein